MASKNVSDFLNQISITLPGSETEPTYTESPSTVDTTRKVYIAPKSEKIPENVVSFTPRETPPLERLDMGSEPKLIHQVSVPLKDGVDTQSTSTESGYVAGVNRWEPSEEYDFLYGAGSEIMSWIEDRVENIDEYVANWNEVSSEWCSRLKISSDQLTDAIQQGLYHAKESISMWVQKGLNKKFPGVMDALSEFGSTLNQYGISYDDGKVNLDSTKLLTELAADGLALLKMGIPGMDSSVIDGKSNYKIYQHTLNSYKGILKSLKPIVTLKIESELQRSLLIESFIRKTLFRGLIPDDVQSYGLSKGIPSEGSLTIRRSTDDPLDDYGLEWSEANHRPEYTVDPEEVESSGNANHLQYTYLEKYDESNKSYKTDLLKNKEYLDKPHQYDDKKIVLQSGYIQDVKYDNVYDLQNELRSRKLLHGYSSMSGFQFGSNHNWKIKIRPYYPSAEGIKDIRTVAPPNLPYYTTIDPSSGRREYKNFGEDCPVLSYSFNMGSIRTETFRLFNSASHEVFAGVNFNMILTLSILDDVHGSMMKYMLQYMNFAYNPSAGTLRPFYELLFEIELVILEATGGGINHHMKLIGIPIDYAPMLDGSQDPNETRVDIVMSIVGMIPYTNPTALTAGVKVQSGKDTLYSGIKWKDIQSNMISDDDRVNAYLPGAYDAIEDGLIAAQEIAKEIEESEKRFNEELAKSTFKNSKDDDTIPMDQAKVLIPDKRVEIQGDVKKRTINTAKSWAETNKDPKAKLVLTGDGLIEYDSNGNKVDNIKKTKSIMQANSDSTSDLF